ncbi:TPA: hypothetical protein DIC38_02985 [Candidatus Nomurabacteria bacterium]|nr:MAG: hypothetical protein O210_OD1C00001G0188 [Parcubacteria bacterium RAAC4_OD1_1]HCY26617.1 hypothetical protein [Candidatus Nomurabacteria bacterium]
MNPLQENNKPWWRDGVLVFGRVSAYISVPVILASFLGKYLDEKRNTGNLFFFICIGISFFVTIYLIWKEMKIYKKKLDISSKIEEKFKEK